MITKSSKAKLADLMYDLTVSQLTYNDSENAKIRINTMVGIARYMHINKFISKENFNKISDLEKNIKRKDSITNG